ncbi:MAG: hypothetical protein QGH82_02745, partial [Candidatus Woesearchaeota archaeon]|nr:hypothetical protein [Candidatus Woesearchaeota archaeon]
MFAGFTSIWVYAKQPCFVSYGGRYIIIFEVDGLVPVWGPYMEESDDFLGTFKLCDNVFRERCGVYINDNNEVCLDIDIVASGNAYVPEDYTYNAYTCKAPESSLAKSFTEVPASDTSVEVEAKIDDFPGNTFEKVKGKKANKAFRAVKENQVSGESLSGAKYFEGCVDEDDPEITTTHSLSTETTTLRPPLTTKTIPPYPLSTETTTLRTPLTTKNTTTETPPMTEPTTVEKPKAISHLGNAADPRVVATFGSSSSSSVLPPPLFEEVVPEALIEGEPVSDTPPVVTPPPPPEPHPVPRETFRKRCKTLDHLMDHGKFIAECPGCNAKAR